MIPPTHVGASWGRISLISGCRRFIGSEGFERGRHRRTQTFPKLFYPSVSFSYPIISSIIILSLGSFLSKTIFYFSVWSKSFLPPLNYMHLNLKVFLSNRLPQRFRKVESKCQNFFFSFRLD